jgi:hypothetical protein
MDTKRMIAVALFIGSLGFLVSPRAARADCGWCEERRPYGDYCEDWRSGRYGANDPVKTADEARKRLQRFFEDDDVVVGKITEQDSYFEADIRNPAGELEDRVIIDKRTGRIRSVF